MNAPRLPTSPRKPGAEATGKNSAASPTLTSGPASAMPMPYSRTSPTAMSLSRMSTEPPPMRMPKATSAVPGARTTEDWMTAVSGERKRWMPNCTLSASSASPISAFRITTAVPYANEKPHVPRKTAPSQLA